jgi:hypothetical protein
VVDGRTFGHQSNRRSTRIVGKPHHHVVEEEGSLASTASSERDTSSNNDYNSKGEESEGFELPVASSIMKEQTKAPNKRTPTPNAMYSPPILKYCEVHFDVKILKVTTLLKAQYL